MKLKSSLNIYFTLIRILIKEWNEGFVKIFLELSTIVIRLVLLFIIYHNLFIFNGGNLGGQAYLNIVWSIFLYFLFMQLNISHKSRLMAIDIKNGTIQDKFTKPYSFLTYHSVHIFGERLATFLLLSTFMLAGMIFFLGIPEHMLSLYFVFTFFITFILCFILSDLISSLVGLSAFWIEDSAPLDWIKSKFVMIFGGAFVPVALFPDFMKNIAIWSPFGASQFVTHTAYTTWIIDAPKLISIQFFWIIILGIVVFLVSKQAYKRVVANGG